MSYRNAKNKNDIFTFLIRIIKYYTNNNKALV